MLVKSDSSEYCNLKISAKELLNKALMKIQGRSENNSIELRKSLLTRNIMAPASFWNTEHVFNHTWDLVATFYWSRYPNPFSSHVFSEDMVECAVGEDGVLRTKRLIVKTNKLPWWGKHLFSAKKVAVVEETTVDPTSRVMTTYTRNIGLTIFMGTTEKNFYR